LKKTISILLCLALLTNSVGFLIIFKFLQSQAQSDIKAMLQCEIPMEKLELIAISNHNQYKQNWKKENNEFLYEGRMYDVVKMKISKDTTYYYCINDTREEDLFANQAELIKQNVNDSIAHNKTAQKLFQQLVQDYFFSKSELNLFAGISRLNPANLRNNYSSFILDIPSPPPKA
jgi:hypothetical protein